jgi:hypothetical protein
MTHFLWVEDFKASETNREDNIISSTVKLVFGSILNDKELDQELAQEDEYDAQDFLAKNGVFLKLNLLEALEFIRNPNELAKIDFVVLDVDMPLKRDGQKDSHNYLAPLIEQYQSEAELKKIAGYQIYIDLVIDLGFPKSHILFCSNHAGYFEQFVEKFKSSNIKFPELLQKEHNKEIKDWLTDAQSDYFVLRRGIIEGCQYLKTLPEDKLGFNRFIKDSEKNVSLEDMHNYLGVLENFLLLREPGDKAALYKLFIRTLAHEWDAAEAKQLNGQKEFYALSWIMKMSRNWLAHGKVFEQLTAQDVAYLFIVNMRAMFDLDSNLLAYEKNLLHLFTDVISVEDMQNTIGKGFKDRNIPLVKNYAILLKKTGNTWQAINFHDALNNLQKNKDKGTDSEFLIKGLYQTFWFLTSSGSVFIPFDEDKIKGFTQLQYQFNYFDYHHQKQDYLFELARHIYNRSFS